MQERTQKEEGPNFFSSPGMKSRNSHESYMEKVFAYWKVPANILQHVLRASDADEPSNAPPRTTHKRPMDDTEAENSMTKRERLVNESSSRRRGLDDGTYRCTRRPPAFTYAFIGDATAEAPSSKRRHDE